MSDIFVKLSTATSKYTPIWIWVRTISSSSPPQTSSLPILRPLHSKPNLSFFPLNINNTLHNHFRTRDYSPVFSKDQDGWRVTPCPPSDHLQNLGFPFHGHIKSLSSSSSSSSFSSCRFSSRPEGGLGLSEYSGPSSDLKGGILADMGSENEDQHQHKQRNQSSKLLTLPTILTLGRVASVPLLVCTFYTDSSWGAAATTSIFIAAAITDWLDGYIARKMKLGSALGAFLDPVADKLMVAATLVLLCTKPLDVAIFGQVPWLLTVPSIIIISREITMSAVREWAASQNSKLLEAVAVNNLGKWKTATQMTALIILLATRDSSLEAPAVLVGSGILLLYISAGLTFWSLVVYVGKIWKVLLK